MQSSKTLCMTPEQIIERAIVNRITEIRKRHEDSLERELQPLYTSLKKLRGETE